MTDRRLCLAEKLELLDHQVAVEAQQLSQNPMENQRVLQLAD
jgi:hypothetical protein